MSVTRFTKKADANRKAGRKNLNPILFLIKSLVSLLKRTVANETTRNVNPSILVKQRSVVDKRKTTYVRDCCFLMKNIKERIEIQAIGRAMFSLKVNFENHMKTKLVLANNIIGAVANDPRNNLPSM